jgi:phosphatidylserine decarboxylase
VLGRIFPPINRAGWPFVGSLALVTLGLAAVHGDLVWVGALLTAWCAYFFRDPDRVTPTREELIMSPADGVVQAIERSTPPDELAMGDVPRSRVSIFMNVFDVHVNRIPCDGVVTALKYTPGRFFNASLDKASAFNERNSVRVTAPGGWDVVCVQIAGLIARRIRCALDVSQSVRAGERFGLIRFGSRVDVYLPEGVAPLVSVGQRTVAGETVVADVRAQEPARGGEVRAGST